MPAEGLTLMVFPLPADQKNSEVPRWMKVAPPCGAKIWGEKSEQAAFSSLHPFLRTGAGGARDAMWVLWFLPHYRRKFDGFCPDVGFCQLPLRCEAKADIASIQLWPCKRKTSSLFVGEMRRLARICPRSVSGKRGTFSRSGSQFAEKCLERITYCPARVLGVCTHGLPWSPFRCWCVSSVSVEQTVFLLSGC